MANSDTTADDLTHDKAVAGVLLDSLIHILPYGLPAATLLDVLVQQHVSKGIAASLIREGLGNGSLVLTDSMNIAGEHSW